MMTSIEQQIQQSTRGDAQFSVPRPPVFDDSIAEQTYLKQRLAAAFRVFALHGFDEGLAGHITVRDNIDPDTFWVNPLAIHFALIKASDLVRVDHQGNIVEGHHPINNAAFAIHSRIHQARPDVNAIAHAHTTYGRAFSALGQQLQPISQDACAFYNNHALLDTFTGVVAQLSEGDMIATALADHCAVILQNHGLLTVASSVDAACAIFCSMERCCQSQLLAQAAGPLKLVDHQTALHTRQVNASTIVTWGNFQPLYQQVLAQDASFLT
ncbi:class II aldolase/adducin family protein [Shewanella intestini]|uniref:Class II aldolase/adducin family protein n=1 Tax=Shewanella intestini TaxID=2017544 RepID=A0ABS5I4F7_9GAMM|nr:MULTISPECIES: class II aldolase/adducin family protein [Shewanella]MBR9728908.1 class II aldolase/adducin family protein [Shewanella intestini]MRG37026.1 class II aldolase/adducin family protein [Shewanella sp. XMDDZSB0408]